MDKREKIIKIRATESEYDALVKRSSGPRLAEWMQEYCLDAKVPPVNTVPKVRPSIIEAAFGNGE
ncbi:hypothetical protein [Enterovibrio norvegicus]|uniref:hypothetical protein n=1 Tax=Enterovibrio norvegicus TaxID=188144 RepID=UPI003899B713